MVKWKIEKNRKSVIGKVYPNDIELLISKIENKIKYKYDNFEIFRTKIKPKHYKKKKLNNCNQTTLLKALESKYCEN